MFRWPVQGHQSGEDSSDRDVDARRIGYDCLRDVPLVLKPVGASLKEEVEGQPDALTRVGARSPDRFTNVPAPKSKALAVPRLSTHDRRDANPQPFDP